MCEVKKWESKGAYGFLQAVLAVYFVFLLVNAGQAQLSNLVVPLVPESETPEIDGTVKADEWKQAVSLAGFVHVKTNLLEDRGRAHFIADDNHIYFSIATPLTEKEKKPEAHDFERDQLKESFKDERIEVNIAPPNYHKRGTFQLIISYSGSMYDSKMDTSTDEEDVSWNPEWTRKQTIKKGTWHFEGKIPITELNVPEGEAAGAWGFNIGRAWSGNQTDMSALNPRMHNRPKVQVIPGAPAFRVEGFGDLSAGDVNVSFSALKYQEGDQESGSPEKLEATCLIRKGGNSLLRKSKELPVKAPEPGTVSFKKELSPGTYRLLILVEDPDGPTYYVNKTKFKVSPQN